MRSSSALCHDRWCSGTEGKSDRSTWPGYCAGRQQSNSVDYIERDISWRSWPGSDPQQREAPSQGRKSSCSGKDVLPETTTGRRSHPSRSYTQRKSQLEAEGGVCPQSPVQCSSRSICWPVKTSQAGDCWREPTNILQNNAGVKLRFRHFSQIPA